jgi:nitrogen regulatory protein PII
MLYKAKVDFSGIISMSLGDVGEIADASIAKDLLKAGYIEEIKPAEKGETAKATSNKKEHFGILFTLDVCDFHKSGSVSQTVKNQSSNIQGENMATSTHQMINVIVNKGYAEDAMAAARKAGAGGGTIIGARGTAKEGDAQFFGMNIVPEKDMLMILVPTEKKDDIIKAISELPCLSEAGSGIIFCNNANDFTLLGKSEKAE